MYGTFCRYVRVSASFSVARCSSPMCGSARWITSPSSSSRSEEHTSELQSPCNLVCRLLLEKKNKINSERRKLKINFLNAYDLQLTFFYLQDNSSSATPSTSTFTTFLFAAIIYSSHPQLSCD